MDLKTLKKGDKITIQWGHDDSLKAKILENYPQDEKILMRVNFGLWGLMGENLSRSYHDYNFELLRSK